MMLKHPLKKRVRLKPRMDAMLNDIQCRKAKPQANPYKLPDSKGLHLEVKPNGVKAWRFRFKLSGKESVFAIGDYPAVSLEWLALKDWEATTKARRLDMLKRIVFPSIGLLPIKQVTPAHILDILKRTGKTRPAVAVEARRAMQGVFDLAICTLRADADPVHPVRKALPTVKQRA